jgi:hypothetical protein
MRSLLCASSSGSFGNRSHTPNLRNVVVASMMSTYVLTFYDQSGRAVAYLHDDGDSIYLYRGTPVAYLVGDSVYGYSGAYLGWLRNGWIFDRSGGRVFFTKDASGGPIRPVRKVRPIRGVRGVRPVKGIRQVRPIRPVRSLSWSALSGEAFFE